MRPSRLYGHPPGASRVGLRSIGRIPLAGRDAAERLASGLSALFGGREVTLHASGREALRLALAHLARRSDRREVIVPAYTCFSVPSAAVAAGLRVRLVDVDERGRVSRESLQRLPLDRAAALVVCNLFGNPEPVKPLQGLLEPAGVALVDDAAQAVGGRLDDASVGARGDLGVVSLGRGKPLSTLGGGALAWADKPPADAVLAGPRPERVRALLRALAWNAAVSPWLFPWLEAIPSLRIGETEFDPGFGGGPLSGSALALAASQLAAMDAARERRARTAERLTAILEQRTDCVPIGPPPGGRSAVPRLAVRVSSPEARDRAVAALRGAGFGASPMYPSGLAEVAELRPHLAEGIHESAVGSWLAARIVTLSTTHAWRAAQLERLGEILETGRARAGGHVTETLGGVS